MSRTPSRCRARSVRGTSENPLDSLFPSDRETLDLRLGAAINVQVGEQGHTAIDHRAGQASARDAEIGKKLLCREI